MIDLDYYKNIASDESEMSQKAHEFKITLRDLIADVEREFSSRLKPQVSGHQLAEQFHKLYEKLASSHNYETRIDTREFNPENNNGKLMIAVSEKILKWLFR